MIAPARILIVEDDPQVRQLNCLALAGAGYQVDVAVDGQAGWEAFCRGHYDLVITDNNMPRMTGMELIRHITLSPKPAPVVLASACVSLEDQAEARQMKIAGKLIKPFRLAQLLDMVKSALGEVSQMELSK